MTQYVNSVLQAEIAWLSLTEFTEVSGLDAVQVRELVDMGILSPGCSGSGDWSFNPQTMVLARRLRRLRQDLDLDLDLQALALGYRLLERIAELEAQLCRARAAVMPAKDA